jgi:hypothetical protein
MIPHRKFGVSEPVLVIKSHQKDFETRQEKNFNKNFRRQKDKRQARSNP